MTVCINCFELLIVIHLWTTSFVNLTCVLSNINESTKTLFYMYYLKKDKNKNLANWCILPFFMFLRNDFIFIMFTLISEHSIDHMRFKQDVNKG